MSLEQLKAFLEKAKGDTSLQEKLKAEGADPVAIAKDAGFRISVDDLKTAQSEVSEEELESVDGGTCQQTGPTFSTIQIRGGRCQ